jgi:pyruvate-formate lyase
MKTFVQQIRDELMSTEDTICLQRACLVTEAYQMYKDDPIPIKRAKSFAHILRNMDLDLKSNPIFAGNTSSKLRGWMLIPEYGFSVDGQVIIENEGLKNILDGQIPDDIKKYWADKSFGGNSGIGHLAVDLNRVVHEGLEAMIAEIQEYDNEMDLAKNEYRQAMLIALDAVIGWSNRYADSAELTAKTETNPSIREILQRVAKACRQVPAKPARDLFEGLQAIVLIHLAIAIEGHGMSVSIGLPDRILASFIDENFDPEFAINLISAFMLKITGNSLFGRGSKTQAITIGGLDHQGQDACNALTLCFLEACNRVRIGDPHLFLRWHEHINSQVKQKAIEMLSNGVSMPLLIGDSATTQGFINAGVAKEDAWDYCVIGCNELGIPGCSMESATAMNGSIQYIGLLNNTLLEHSDLNSIQDMQDLMNCLENTMKNRAIQMRQWGEQHKKQMSESVPTPFTSALMRNCIKRGQDLLVGMDYQLAGMYERGFTNAVNALSAIEKVIFKECSISLSELVLAMRSNFTDESVRIQLLSAPKWGNNEESADQWAIQLIEMRERILNDIDAQFGKRQHTVCHVIRSLHHLDGRNTPATPDGRHAWTPLADSIGAQIGTAKVGPTAVLNSLLKLNASQYYRGGYNLNLTFSKAKTETEALFSLVETFFGKGGQELQINCLDVNMLHEARKNPEKYGDLVVRVAGFSTRFVDLSTAEQNELIERVEAIS